MLQEAPVDLRREIRRMMSEGMSDAEIADFLVARYGEFVLYNPRRSGKTLMLWIAPVLLIGFGREREKGEERG